jgi:haloacetate dehalogenase
MSEIANATTTPAFFPDFAALDTEIGGVRFSGVVGGSGPPVLLLHGFPQTHIAWRKIAPSLSKAHTLIIPDLPGYGSSQVFETTPRWTKRRVAEVLVTLMESLGYTRFAVVGHDRGARVGYRLALDYPEHVSAFSSLTVVPTLDAMAAVDFRFALKNFHWFFFAQDGDIPERLLEAAPDAFLEQVLSGMAGGLDMIDAAALDAYREAFRNAAVRHAICEDYRAALNEDLELDAADRAAGRKLVCPVNVLWPAIEQRAGAPTPIQVWSRWADDVVGASTSGGHLMPEDAPDEVLAELLPFLASGSRDAAL